MGGIEERRGKKGGGGWERGFHMISGFPHWSTHTPVRQRESERVYAYADCSSPPLSHPPQDLRALEKVFFDYLDDQHMRK